MFERYAHHGTRVWVRKDLRGRHREHCLCYSCKSFHPDDPRNNCSIARKVYALCVEQGLTLPVWECPVFVKDKTRP